MIDDNLTFFASAGDERWCRRQAQLRPNGQATTGRHLPATGRVAVWAGAEGWVNANQLRKWVQQREQSNAPASAMALPPARQPIPEPESTRLSPRAATVARLSAQLPNGVKLELECSGHAAALVTAMIAALGARR
jgi:transposase